MNPAFLLVNLALTGPLLQMFSADRHGAEVYTNALNVSVRDPGRYG